MAITREKKEEILKKATTIVKNSQSVVFVNFHGLGVDDTNTLRRELHKEGVSYGVFKKTLVKKALSDSKIEGETPSLDGELALASAEDLIAPARGIYDFAKTHKDTLSILGGIFEGRFMNKEEMTEIASIPPIEVLYGMFVNVINSPIQGFVIALDQIAKVKN